MNWDIMRGRWLQVKGSARKEWGNLTDDDFAKIGGDKEKLVGKLQEKYGWARNEAEKRVDDWVQRHSND
jgi:uncharacterized protein YjbJ (UPF0337 family)